MYLRKSNGPRAVTLANGDVLSLADLPPPDTRWVASRKAVVVNAVMHGLLTRDEALLRYGLSGEEFDAWCKAIDSHGVRALRVTALQQYRQP
ncbi:DUF1153 domain-containing protein [Paracoccus aerodenitrificans]|uniref:CtrA inhibitor SciP n=1 Tax=Paracoccus aerodenitrificans TaxID=3017781 RepID=UPI0022F04551|nr:DUF1153 domain-containing protein [Paracoccus aerodenitrificans]WBU65442.1 DUF1153 domain-containing protein [Paracoccus aerodenitrificans]